MIDAKKIFIADDDPDILDVIKLMLKTRGYDVSSSINANELFEYSKKDLPDLILLDIWMAGLDGRDVCARVKKDDLTKDIPVIFISANSNIKEIAKDCHADYIAKPFDMQSLLKKVHDSLYSLSDA